MKNKKPIFHPCKECLKLATCVEYKKFNKNCELVHYKTSLYISILELHRCPDCGEIIQNIDVYIKELFKEGKKKNRLHILTFACRNCNSYFSFQKNKVKGSKIPIKVVRYYCKVNPSIDSEIEKHHYCSYCKFHLDFE